MPLDRDTGPAPLPCRLSHLHQGCFPRRFAAYPSDVPIEDMARPPHTLDIRSAVPDPATLQTRSLKPRPCSETLRRCISGSKARPVPAIRPLTAPAGFMLVTSGARSRFSLPNYCSTQSKVRVTAFFHSLYSLVRAVSSADGSQVLSTPQLARISSVFFQKPAARPAA